MERYNLNLFRMIRIANDITVRQFSEKIGFTASYVCSVENDKRVLTEKYIDNFLAAYHLTREDFEKINTFQKKIVESRYPVEKKYQLLLAACLGLLYPELRSEVEKLVIMVIKELQDKNSIKGDLNIHVLIDDADELIQQLLQDSNVSGFKKIENSRSSYSFEVNGVNVVLFFLKSAQYCGKNFEEVKSELYSEIAAQNSNFIFIDDSFFTPITSLALCEMLVADKIVEPTLCSKNPYLLSLAISELKCNVVYFSKKTKFSSIKEELISKIPSKTKKL